MIGRGQKRREHGETVDQYLVATHEKGIFAELRELLAEAGKDW